MRIDPGGGGPTVVTPTAQTRAPVADKKVDPAVDRTVQATRMGPEPEHAAAYQISQTLADKSLTQAEKDEYIARLVQKADDPDDKTAKAITGAFEDIGTAWSGAETKDLRSQVTTAIGREVNAGRLTGDDLYALVDPAKNPGSDGARQLLTTVASGPALNRVADRLLGAAKSEGYDINKYQNGPQTLAAAADVANMAASYGATASATAITQEIGNQMNKGPVAGDMTLVQAIMATTLDSSPYGGTVEGRTGFDALSGLINSADTSIPSVQKTTDSLFATLVRSGDDDYAGGLDQGGNRAGALYGLDSYFSGNVSRLSENGWRYDSAGSQYENLVQDFTGKVLLDPANPGADFATDAITGEMNRLATTVNDPKASENDRNAAAQGLGEIVGSVKGGANDAYAHLKADNDAKIGAIRFFTDKITDKIADFAGPLSDAVKAGIDAGWSAASKAADGKAQSDVDKATKGITDLANGLRINIGKMGDNALIAAYDQRFVEHAPDK
ncbi:hypothetical protein DMC47_36325 [Nostoc sp. 3335mG]|nr:hypothetical protein DMC47_36325 [Nostoc sp. 3335mG]